MRRSCRAQWWLIVDDCNTVLIPHCKYKYDQIWSIIAEWAYSLQCKNQLCSNSYLERFHFACLFFQGLAPTSKALSWNPDSIAEESKPKSAVTIKLPHESGLLLACDCVLSDSLLSFSQKLQSADRSGNPSWLTGAKIRPNVSRETRS